MKISTQILPVTFHVASFLTDPPCRAHEFLRHFQAIHAQSLGNLPLYERIQRITSKILFATAAVGYGVLALATTPLGMLLRWISARFLPNGYLYEKGMAQEKEPPEASFTLLSHNVCCVAGGYSITDGGVKPWRYRMNALVEHVKKTDADVTILYEVFDFTAAKAMIKGLKNHYAHFYYNMRPKAAGVSSGIFVASKFPVGEASFTLFPKTSLAGRSKSASKGVFEMILGRQTAPFAKILATHLGHSEKPQFPEDREVESRKKCLAEVISKTEKAHQGCAILITGDLNLDRKELESHHATKLNGFTEGTCPLELPSWLGDDWCAQLTGKAPSAALTLDYTFAKKESVRSIDTDYLETQFDPKQFTGKAISDHWGLFTRVNLHLPVKVANN